MKIYSALVISAAIIGIAAATNTKETKSSVNAEGKEKNSITPGCQHPKTVEALKSDLVKLDENLKVASENLKKFKDDLATLDVNSNESKQLNANKKEKEESLAALIALVNSPTDDEIHEAKNNVGAALKSFNEEKAILESMAKDFNEATTAAKDLIAKQSELETKIKETQNTINQRKTKHEEQTELHKSKLVEATKYQSVQQTEEGINDVTNPATLAYALKVAKDAVANINANTSLDEKTKLENDLKTAQENFNKEQELFKELVDFEKSCKVIEQELFELNADSTNPKSIKAAENDFALARKKLGDILEDPLMQKFNEVKKAYDLQSEKLSESEAKHSEAARLLQELENKRNLFLNKEAETRKLQGEIQEIQGKNDSLTRKNDELKEIAAMDKDKQDKKLAELKKIVDEIEVQKKKIDDSIKELSQTNDNNNPGFVKLTFCGKPFKIGDKEVGLWKAKADDIFEMVEFKDGKPHIAEGSTLPASVKHVKQSCRNKELGYIDIKKRSVFKKYSSHFENGVFSEVPDGYIALDENGKEVEPDLIAHAVVVKDSQKVDSDKKKYASIKIEYRKAGSNKAEDVSKHNPPLPVSHDAVYLDGDVPMRNIDGTFLQVPENKIVATGAQSTLKSQSADPDNEAESSTYVTLFSAAICGVVFIASLVN